MNFEIAEEERRLLLANAREAIAARLERREPRFPGAGPEGSVLEKPCGAFVTLHAGAALRGCIGRMDARLPLVETVRMMAVEAAFGDPRFPPLRPEEAPGISLEISALSPMEPCADPALVRVGVHGVYLAYRGRTGVFLPQVPVEQGWDREEYLDYLCEKAGVPRGSYTAPGARLYTFTAVVFGEERR